MTQGVQPAISICRITITDNMDFWMQRYMKAVAHAFVIVCMRLQRATE